MLDKAIGARIRAAREAAGLSQQDLAVRMGYASAATVSYLEAGDRRITVGDLTGAAHALGVPIESFLDRPTAGDVPKQLSLRASVLEPSARRSVVDFFSFAQKHGAPTPPRPTTLRRRRAGDAAREILDLTGAKEPPVNPRTVAQRLGLSVFDWPFPDEVSGLLVYYGDRTAIGVNASDAVVRQRFTVAHEIGHFVYGADSDAVVLDYVSRERGFSFESTVSGLDEVKANQFAADLLMPAPWVREDFKRYDSDVPFLARRYMVSEQAMWFRLLNLKLVSDTE